MATAAKIAPAHPARTVARHLALVALALAVIPAAVLWRRAALHRGALRDWASTSSVVLRLTGTAAQAWIRERTGDLHLLTGDAGRSPRLFRIAVPGQPVLPDSSVEAALARAASQLQRANGAQYQAILNFDGDGRLIATSSPFTPTAALRALALESLTTDSVVVGRVLVGADSSTAIGFAQRVLYSGPGHPSTIPANGVLGTVEIVIDPRVSLFPALEGGSIQANDGATTLLMARGDSAFEYALPPDARRGVRVVAWRDLPSFERQALSMVLDTAAHVVADDVVLARPMPGTPWAVLRRARPSSVFAAADSRLAGECAALLLVTVIAVWLLRLRLRIAQARRSREIALSERRYRLVAENATDLIARFGSDDRIDYVSPAIKWLLGYEPEQVVGRRLAELRELPDLAIVADVVDRARQRRGTSRIEHQVRNADGDVIWLETLARAVDAEGRDESDAAPRADAEVVIVTRDISARKRAEEALRDALEFVRAVVESSPVAIIALDLDYRVVEWNRAAERLFGWTAAEIIGQPYPLTPAEQLEEREQLRERTVLHGHVSDVTVRRRRKDGTLADVAVSSGVIHGAGDAPAGIVVLATDLTERVRLETQLRQSQKMEAVGLLAGGIAHDFNNLLTVVTSYSSLLLRELPDGDPVREDLTEIHTAAKRGAALVAQLLAFSRQQVLTPQPVDVNALVTNMKQLLKRVLPGKIVLQQVLCDDAVVIEADPGQMEQVLLNLVVNARDAIGDVAGTITITTACEPERGRDGVDDADAPRRVVITVRDTGCGMPAHMLEHIFDPFFTTKERGQGTGLGLATVQGIVAQSGGRIAVRSEEGVGTEFVLSFPVIDRDPAMLSETPASAAGRAAGALSGVVLLVEDDARVRRVTARILGGAGYEVIAAADATEALAIFEEQAARIDIIVTDMMMPDLTGAEMIARIRACGYDVPALFISGHTTPGPLAAAAVDGSRFVQKPFAPDELTEKVREVIARRVSTSSTWSIPARGELTRR